MKDPLLITLSPKKLVGLCLPMTLAHAEIAALWQQFGPLVKTIENRADANRISMTVYPDGFSFEHWDAGAAFTKWAAVEVIDNTDPPAGLQAITIPGGLYAMFVHEGPAAEFGQTMQYIFGQWFPASAYQPDYRPHFEILGPDYNPAAADAEESIWIPVQRKHQAASE